MSKHTIGIIGFGGMAKYHFDALKNYERAYVKGVWDVNPARMELAVQLGLTAYKSLECLLCDSDIDLVLVSTTNEAHKELTIKAFEAGKNVICEKPAALNSAELTEMIDAAKKYNRVFTVDQNRRTNRDCRLMKKIAESGEIGEAYSIESRVEAARGISAWRTVKRLGGGIMLDWGVHLIDQLMYMLNQRVTSVFCKMYRIKYTEIEDNFTLFLTFESGVTAVVEVGTNNYITRPRGDVLGKSGTLQINDWDCRGKIVKRGDVKNVFDEAIIYTSAGPTKTMLPMQPSENKTVDICATDDIVDNFLAVYDQFIDAAEGKAELTIKPEQALRVMQVIDAAFESDKTGKAIDTSI